MFEPEWYVGEPPATEACCACGKAAQEEYYEVALETRLPLRRIGEISPQESMQCLQWCAGASELLMDAQKKEGPVVRLAFAASPPHRPLSLNPRCPHPSHAHTQSPPPRLPLTRRTYCYSVARQDDANAPRDASSCQRRISIIIVMLDGGRVDSFAATHTRRAPAACW